MEVFLGVEGIPGSDNPLFVTGLNDVVLEQNAFLRNDASAIQNGICHEASFHEMKFVLKSVKKTFL